MPSQQRLRGDWRMLDDARLARVTNALRYRERNRLRAGRSGEGCPNRGVTITRASDVAHAACCCLGLRASTLSGSRINSAVGSQSRTVQITSRSSSRIVVGVPVQSPVSSLQLKHCHCRLVLLRCVEDFM
jgi:hypothetical protein